MSITERLPMQKRRYSAEKVYKTPKRSPRTGKVWRTPRRLSTTADQGLDIIWDNNSPSPRAYAFRKRKKPNDGESSSSGGEISDLVQKLAEKSGCTPDPNPPLLKFWMQKDATTECKNSKFACSRSKESESRKIYQTQSRRPRRKLRKNNKLKTKLLSQELNALVKKVEEQESSNADSRKECHTKNEVPNSSESKTREKEASCEQLFDIWDDDEEEVILSQIDITQLCTGIKDNQPLFDTDTKPVNCVISEKTPKKTTDMAQEEICPDNEFVSQPWQLNGASVYETDDDDDDGLLQSALEDFEKSQNPNSATNLGKTCSKVVLEQPSLSPPLVRRNTHKSTNTLGIQADKTVCTNASMVIQKLPLSIKKDLCGKKTDESKTKGHVLGRQHLQNVTNRQILNRPRRYTKEDIEQKRRQAQEKRKQKLLNKSS